MVLLTNYLIKIQYNCNRHRPPLHPVRPPPSLTHISTAPWDQRKPTYSHINRCKFPHNIVHAQYYAIEVCIKRPVQGLLASLIVVAIAV